MRTLNGIDLLGQSMIIGVWFIVEITALITGQFDIMVGLAIYAALFLGPWQLISSFLTTLAKRKHIGLRYIHLLAAIVYLIVAATATVLEINEWILVAVPALLAAFYYVITIRTFTTLKTHKKLGYFFEHNFHNLLKI